MYVFHYGKKEYVSKITGYIQSIYNKRWDTRTARERIGNGTAQDNKQGDR